MIQLVQRINYRPSICRHMGKNPLCAKASLHCVLGRPRMPPSQLKKLKVSLRENGVVGQQRSKKQQRRASKNGALQDSRLRKNAALQSIREQFNPFEVKPTGRSKHDVTSSHTAGGRVGKPVVARPGTTKGLGEENRRKTLLIEMQRRRKVGGILDRRFGENDATLTPEEKALRRFVAEKQRANKKSAVFDLEDDEEDGDLTHLGQALSFGSSSRVDDFNEADLESLNGDADAFADSNRPHKRRRLSDSDVTEDEVIDARDKGVPERHKTKNEIMKEVMSKSKLHKYERQQAKEDDDDLRAELDKGLPDLFALIRGHPAQAPESAVLSPAQGVNGSMNPDRMALLNGKERSQADKEYDQRLRQMAMDQRAKPTVPTLTSEEKAAQEAQRLKDLERRRIRRMKGEQSDSELEEAGGSSNERGDIEEDEEEVTAFDLGSGLGSQPTLQELGVEDEDEFVLDDDIVATSSEDEMSNQGKNGPLADESDEDSDEDAEFVHGLLSRDDTGREGLSVSGANATTQLKEPKTNLAFTYPCPQTHEEFLDITKNISLSDLPTVVQRIRALYQPQLASDNRTKLGNFAMVLVDQISYLANMSEHPPFVVLEALIRHIHSLAKAFPHEVGNSFRSHLKSVYENRPTTPTPGDLIIFTAIGSIFPTSDHFHQVVTPAMLCMTRYLGQRIPSTLPDLAMGTYIVSLCLSFQKDSKRYIPEVINYTLNAIYALLPAKPKTSAEIFPHHILSENLQIRPISNEFYTGASRLNFWDIMPALHVRPSNEEQRLKYALLATHINLVEIMANLWADKSAFCEMFDPILTAIQFVSVKKCSVPLGDTIRAQAQKTAEKVGQLLDQAVQARQPLRLHDHRPLAIKTSIPKFEESYNPDKHYDPDRDRAELSKLKAEHKKERKGALRELRKDANFMARESLREKKEKDSAYEKRYKRLVAEIQGEEGREARLYEREKKMRKGKK